MKKDVANVTDAVRGLKDRAGEALAGGSKAVQGVAAKMGDLGGVGAESMKSLVDDVNGLLPAIKEAGYHVVGVDVDAAVPPKISIHCRMEIDVAAEDRARLIESLAGSRVSSLAVKLLFQVSDVQKALRLGTLRPTEVVLEMGLSPAVRLRYREPGVTTPSA